MESATGWAQKVVRAPTCTKKPNVESAGYSKQLKFERGAGADERLKDGEGDISLGRKKPPNLLKKLQEDVDGAWELCRRYRLGHGNAQTKPINSRTRPSCVGPAKTQGR